VYYGGIIFSEPCSLDGFLPFHYRVGNPLRVEDGGDAKSLNIALVLPYSLTDTIMPE